MFRCLSLVVSARIVYSPNMYEPLQQTNEAPVVRRKTSSGDSSMGHPPWGILHIAIPMRQYLSLMYTVSIRGRQCTRSVYRDSLTPFFSPALSIAAHAIQLSANMGERTAAINGQGYMLPVAFISISNGMSFANLGLKPCNPSLSAGCSQRNTFRCLSGRCMSCTEKTKRYRFAVVNVHVLSIVIR